MISCPHCGNTLPADAKFCTGCGESLELQCRHCGETVPADANFCPNCREQVGGGGSGQAQQRDAREGPLRLKPREFAYRLEGDELGKKGLRAWVNRRKEVEIEEGNRALFLQNGKLVKTLGPGRHQLETLGQRVTNSWTTGGEKTASQLFSSRSPAQQSTLSSTISGPQRSIWWLPLSNWCSISTITSCLHGVCFQTGVRSPRRRSTASFGG